jgi:ribose transport system substrate-binding protein
MAASAVRLARLLAQGKGMADLVELEPPQSVTLASETVTRDNVSRYLPLGFES